VSLHDGAEGRIRVMSDEKLDVRPKLTPWIVLWALVIFLLAEPFALQLEGIDPSGSANQVAKPFALYLHFAVFALVGAYVFLRRSLAATLRAAFAAPFLIALAILGVASAIWTTEPLPTLLAGMEFIATIFCLSAVITSQNRPDAVRSVLIALSICVFISVVWSLALPHYGQHDRNDLYQGGHVGKWRGIYRHKNILGQISGITVGVWLSPSGRLLPRYYRYATIAAGVLCLAFAQSASGVLIALAGFGLGFVLFRLKGVPRAVGLSVGVLACALLLGAGSEIMSSVLVALGRSPTFSGRTYLWEAALKIISDHWLLGYGLAGIHDEEIMGVFKAISGEVHDAHNSYLEIMIALGIAGLFLHMAAIAYAVFKRGRTRLRGEMNLGRQAMIVVILMWLLAATVEAAPFMPGATVETFGLFAIIWLSVSTAPERRSGKSPRANGGGSADLSVTQTGQRRGRQRGFVDLED
jgi:O-antigen ligase